MSIDERRGDDPYNLARFIKAQEPIFRVVLSELEAGKKQTHWMWFIFPQMLGLGQSRISEFYGISSLEEAEAYLKHETLGPRLKLCTSLVLTHIEKPLKTIFGVPDNYKFQSCMTLFAEASKDPASLFWNALTVFCRNQLDEQTLALI